MRDHTLNPLQIAILACLFFFVLGLVMGFQLGLGAH